MELLTDPSLPQHTQRSCHKHVPDICMAQRWVSGQKESGLEVFWFWVNEGVMTSFMLTDTI